jgi:hypothetical protein
MILTKTVFIKPRQKCIHHYESLGYFIPRYKHKCGKILIKSDTKIEVKVSDLLPNNKSKILCRCEACQQDRIISFYQYSRLCHKCTITSDDYKKNMSLSTKGRKISEQHKNRLILLQNGSKNSNYNSCLTEYERKHRRCISGISKWTKQVKQKYKYICQKCNHNGKLNDGYMIAHHINNYNDFKEQRTDINNGTCLCKNCHKEIHKQFGRKTTEEHYQLFLIS